MAGESHVRRTHCTSTRRMAKHSRTTSGATRGRRKSTAAWTFILLRTTTTTRAGAGNHATASSTARTRPAPTSQRAPAGRRSHAIIWSTGRTTLLTALRHHPRPAQCH